MTTNSDIYTLCFCEQFDFTLLQQQCPATLKYNAYRNVLHCEREHGQIFIFDYGIIVFWDIDADGRRTILDELEPYALNPLPHTIDDEFTYETGTGNRTIKNDHINLPDDDVMVKLAVCHAIAQSTKLALFEQRILGTINDTAHIPKNIATTGSSRVGRKALAKLRGRLFLAKSDIMLKYDLLDIPDFFWEYPELDIYYSMLAEYLEVRQRVDVLNKKLETIHELLQMMADEQKHKHSSLLEWIIIWLIAFEILVFLVHDIFFLI